MTYLLWMGLYGIWGWKEYMNNIHEFFQGSPLCCKFQKFLYSGILWSFSAYQGRIRSQLFPSVHLIYNVLLQRVELGLKWSNNYDNPLNNELTDCFYVNQSFLSFREINNTSCGVLCINWFVTAASPKSPIKIIIQQ